MAATITRATLLSAEEFLAADHSGWELVHGIPEEIAVGLQSSWLGSEIHRRLSNHVIANDLGAVFSQDAALAIWPNEPHIRKPDVFFVRRENLPADWFKESALTAVPDLVVEVISPNDQASDLFAKIREYRQAGVPLIWVIQPEQRSALVYANGELDSEATGVLSGGTIVPGFELVLPDLFSAASR